MSEELKKAVLVFDKKLRTEGGDNVLESVNPRFGAGLPSRVPFHPIRSNAFRQISPRFCWNFSHLEFLKAYVTRAGGLYFGHFLGAPREPRQLKL